MINQITDSTVLNNGVNMPLLGLGVWKAKNGDEVRAVKAALKVGYRSIDTAAAYGNEEGVGQGIRESGVPREELFVTTKVWNSDQGYDSTLRAFETSRGKLGLDYLDLYLVHWPGTDKYKDTWRALEKLYRDGLVRAIGVCNFHTHHLEDLLSSAEVVPALNQIEFHPLLTQVPLREYCKKRNIQIEAWSPLAQGELLENDKVKEIASKSGKTASQIILRWDLQHGVVTIPKSVHEERIAANADIFNFSLHEEDMKKLDAMNENRRKGPDPDKFFLI